MVPLFAFLLFVDEPPQAIAAPSANLTPDFRLAGEDGPRKAIINLDDIARKADGRMQARVYFIHDGEPPRAFASYMTFDCAGRTSTIEHVWQLGSDLETERDGQMDETRTPEAGSAGAQAMDFVCGTPEARRQRPYLGSNAKSAIRLADPRFR
ncbi:MAG: hypothetical protein K1X35_04995 [Caulobacteraceae bacterium]|nr:hypothetical protein [Caulobacteraceae bacterium]